MGGRGRGFTTGVGECDADANQSLLGGSGGLNMGFLKRGLHRDQGLGFSD